MTLQPIVDYAATGEMVKTYLLDGCYPDMDVDGSVTPVVYKYTVLTGKVFLASRLTIYLEGLTAFSGSRFGDVKALTNGVVISVNGNTWETWKDNIDLMTCMDDTEGNKIFGRSITGRWTFSQETGAQIEMAAGEIFAVTINDDLSYLTHFRIKIGGRLIDA